MPCGAPYLVETSAVITLSPTPVQNPKKLQNSDKIDSLSMSATAHEPNMSLKSPERRLAQSPPVPVGFWLRFGLPALAFLFILAGYLLSYSWDENDSLDSARWMNGGDIRALVEFRHMIQRLLPLWLWKGLLAVGFHIRSLTVLDAWDFFTATLCVMILYRILLDVTGSRPLAFGGSFAYATAHCVWIYVGSGRLYSTSMFLIFSAYFLDLQLDKTTERSRRLWISFAAGAFICFSCFFWLTHAFSALSVGLLLLFFPVSLPWKERISSFAVYALTGLAVGVVVVASCLQYVEIPLTGPAIHDWVLSAGTQPLQFDALSPMKAAYGQAHGILVMYELPYMINGLMLKDYALAHIASFPWQLFKFLFVWLLLLLVYVYPLFLLPKADSRRRALIAALYVPMAINMYFGLGWLGSDVQRFMPTMLSQFGLGVIAVQDLLGRVSRPRLVGGILAACLVFIAGSNLVESLLPSQKRYMVLEAEMRAIHPLLHSNDLLFSFGRDVSVTYCTMTRYYAGSLFLNTTNDATKWYWDRGDWQAVTTRRFDEVRAHGGRVFAMDRILFGINPPIAAWSDRQHPRPTVKQFGLFLQSRYCPQPSFALEEVRYFELTPRTDGCPAAAPPAGAAPQP